MDAKKVAGLLIAVAVGVPIIATAGPGTLAVIEVGLIGLLYCIRRRRAVGGHSESRPRSISKRRSAAGRSTRGNSVLTPVRPSSQRIAA